MEDGDVLIPPNESVAWIYVRMIVISAIMYAFCTLFYKNGWDAKDLIMILTTVGTVAGFDIFQRAKAPTSDSSKEG